MTSLENKPSGGSTTDPLTGHEYDGIAEYDNPMPTWWRRTFWATFCFSLGYFVHYQLTGNGASVEASYEQDMREQRELVAAQSLGQEMTEDGLTGLMKDAALMKDGRTVFITRCVQCHADRGQGNIGPNLTDDHWIYGSGSLLDLHEIVSSGRAQKGMPAWARQLRPLELAQVVAYIGTLRNTNVPGRPPQGKRIAAAEAPETVPASAGGG
jgi:cytochrome c oxidase cbb3-type subunit 3